MIFAHTISHASGSRSLPPPGQATARRPAHKALVRRPQQQRGPPGRVLLLARGKHAPRRAARLRRSGGTARRRTPRRADRGVHAGRRACSGGARELLGCALRFACAISRRSTRRIASFGAARPARGQRSVVECGPWSSVDRRFCSLPRAVRCRWIETRSSCSGFAKIKVRSGEPPRPPPGHSCSHPSCRGVSRCVRRGGRADRRPGAAVGR